MGSSFRRDAKTSGRDAHPTRKLLLAALLLFVAILPLHATDPDTFSPVVSYQYQDSLDASETTITSPVVSYQYDAGTNYNYLTFTYAHRIGNTDLNYLVEVSDDLKTWDDSGDQVEPFGTPIPAADGVTESVKVRLKVPLGSSSPKQKFIRLKVIHLP